MVEDDRDHVKDAKDCKYKKRTRHLHFLWNQYLRDYFTTIWYSPQVYSLCQYLFGGYESLDIDYGNSGIVKAFKADVDDIDKTK